MGPIRYEFLRRRIAETRALGSGGRIVAVDGHSGAGKSTLSHTLAELTGGDVFTVDDICPGWDGLDRVPDLLANILRPVSAGFNGSYVRYDWIAGRMGARTAISPPKLLIVDGVGSGSAACLPYLNLLIWIDAPADFRKARALERDGDGFASHWDQWAAQEDVLFGAEQTHRHADIVLTIDPRTGILAQRPTETGA